MYQLLSPQRFTYTSSKISNFLSDISIHTYLLPWDQASRYAGSVKGSSLCDLVMSAFQYVHFAPLTGRSGAVGDQVGRQVVPVAMSRTTGCCNLTTKAGISGSDGPHTFNLTSWSRWPGIGAFIYWEHAGALVAQVAQWAQIELKIIVICSEIRGDNRVGADHCHPVTQCPAFTPHLRLRHFQIDHALIPSQFIQTRRSTQKGNKGIFMFNTLFPSLLFALAAPSCASNPRSYP